MTKKTAPKVTPASAKLHYEQAVFEAAKQFAPMVREAFPTETSMLVALSSVKTWFETAMANSDDVRADEFCEHGPLAKFPDQLMTMMVLFVASGVFVSVDPEVAVFAPDNAGSWKLAACIEKPQAE